MNTALDFKSVLTDWLLGMALVAFDFSAGFRLRLERSEIDTDKPQVLYLDVKAMAYIGDLEEWKSFVQSLPMKARRGEEDEPAFAYRLMLLVGAEVRGVGLEHNGTLIIDTADNETITVTGKDDVWEESWSLSEPEDVAGENARFVVCDSEGELSAG